MLRTERGVTLPCLKFAGPNKGPQPTSVIAPIPGNIIRGRADDSTHGEGKAHGHMIFFNFTTEGAVLLRQRGKI